MSRVVPTLTLVAAVLLAACSNKDEPSRPGPTTGTAAVPPTAAVADAATAAPPADATPAAIVLAADADAGPAVVVKPVFHFDDLTKEDQSKYMKDTVTPAMKKAFRAFDGKAFAKFNCRTCHGKGAITKEYDMPNPDLPKLDFDEILAGEHAEVAKFMKEVVTPQMAELLGETVQSPTNPDGFGCLDCHQEK